MDRFGCVLYGNYFGGIKHFVLVCDVLEHFLRYLILTMTMRAAASGGIGLCSNDARKDQLTATYHLQDRRPPDLLLKM